MDSNTGQSPPKATLVLGSVTCGPYNRHCRLRNTSSKPDPLAPHFPKDPTDYETDSPLYSAVLVAEFAESLVAISSDLHFQSLPKRGNQSCCRFTQPFLLSFPRSPGLPQFCIFSPLPTSGRTHPGSYPGPSLWTESSGISHQVFVWILSPLARTPGPSV